MQKYLLFMASFALCLSAKETPQATTDEPTKTEALANLVKEPIKQEEPKTIPIMEKLDNSDIEKAKLVEFKCDSQEESSNNKQPFDTSKTSYGRVIEKVDKDHLVETRLMMGQFTCKDSK